MIDIVIFGMGNIGKRHLQALANLNMESAIYCYDKNNAALGNVAAFIKNNNLEYKNLKVTKKLSEIINTINQKSIIIIATTANDRKEIFDIILNKKPYAIIAEKPLCQNLEDYTYVLDLSREKEIDIYVNFIAHMQPFYHEIRKNVKNTKEFTFYTNLPKWGISTVGIHQFELLTWLFDIKEYKIQSTHLKSIYEQKRKGFYDMAGHIQLMTPEGNICVINNTCNDSFASIQIITNNYLYNVFEQENKMVYIDRKNGFHIENLKYKFVSQYTHKLIQNILNEKESKLLPDVKESFIAHKILFDYMKLVKTADLNIT